MDGDAIREKYTGEVAETYEERRQDSKQWRNEQQAVDLLLHKAITSKTETLLDIPVGTGRFFDLYAQYPVDVVGMDVSDDMLDRAREKCGESQSQITVETGDILDGSTLTTDADIVVCIRLCNWLTLAEIATALENLGELDPTHIIVGIRTTPQVDNGLLKKGWLLQYEIVHRIIHRRWSNANRINIHEEQAWQEILDSCGYTVENRVLVDTGLSGRKYGSEYYIYLLSTE